MNYQQGSIVVLPVPFTDLSSQKQRPCLVISKNGAEDLVVLALTSSQQRVGKYTMLVTQQDLVTGVLPKDSYIKLQKVFTIHKSLIRKEVGVLRRAVCVVVVNQFKKLF